MNPNETTASRAGEFCPQHGSKLAVIAGGRGEGGALLQHSREYAREADERRFVDGSKDHRSHLHD
jgi:hypothetical protein